MCQIDFSCAEKIVDPEFCMSRRPLFQICCGPFLCFQTMILRQSSSGNVCKGN